MYSILYLLFIIRAIYPLLQDSKLYLGPIQLPKNSVRSLVTDIPLTERQFFNLPLFKWSSEIPYIACTISSRPEGMI